MTLRENDELDDLDLNDTGQELTSEEMTALEKLETSASTAPALLQDRFGYAGLSKNVIEDCEAAAERIRNNMRSVIDLGHDLQFVKDTLTDHGQFGKWLRHYFAMTERTAQNYMAVARAFGKTPQVIEHVPPAMLYKLAAKSTPAEVRAEIVKDIEAGTVPEPGEVTDRINQAREVARQAKEAEEAKRQAEALANKIAAMTPGEKEAFDKAEKEKARREKDAKKRKETKAERLKREQEERDRAREESKRVAMELAEFVQDKMGADFGEFCERLEISGFYFEKAIANLYRQTKQPTTPKLTVVGTAPLVTAA